MVQANQQYIMSLRLSSFIAFKFGKKLERKYNITMKPYWLWMCLVGNVAFANVFYIRVVMLTSWNVLSQLRNACFTDTPLSLGTQRSRQVKLINVPLKVLCPLFMTKGCCCWKVCSTHFVCEGGKKRKNVGMK